MNDVERPRNRLDPAVEGGARHGVSAPRGLGASPASRGGRFGRMFAALPAADPGADAIEALVEHLRAAQDGSDDNTRIGAGYTYLGQFIDHDITFDPTSKIERDNDPHALVNFRTPRFDLDSLYGSGPADQPFLYDWEVGKHPGVKLLVGHNPPDRCLAPIDLPRNAQGRAMIADARNDENLMVSQLHLLFIQFHNEVVERTHRKHPQLTCNELFDEARRIVRWHYQWIVTHEFLDRIVGRTMARAVRPILISAEGVTRPATQRQIYHWHGEPVIPVEFSAAAFRFGHSMVRPSYPLLAGMPGIPILPAAGHERELHLGGFRPLPDPLQIHWPHFFGDAARVHSQIIDHSLAAPLYALPPDSEALARLNLHRGRALGLPSGSDVALAMGQAPLEEQQLLPHDFWQPQDSPREREAVLQAPPLWFYLLREATQPKPKGRWLGPIAGRIVAEVLVGLLEADPSSYLRQRPAWVPELDGDGPDDFAMLDLFRYTHPAQLPADR
jgi:hypothetical protein